LKRILFTLFVLLALAYSVSGEAIPGAKDSKNAADRPIYRYVDRNGVEVFTDDPSRIPAKYRSSAKVVELPPAVKMPEAPSPSKPVSPSFATRLRKWVERQPAAYQVIILGVLPIAILSLWVLNFLKKLTDLAMVKLALRLGMLAIVISTAYLCYYIYLRVQAEQWTGPVSMETQPVSSSRQKAEELKKDEADRLKTLEDTANQK